MDAGTDYLLPYLNVLKFWRLVANFFVSPLQIILKSCHFYKSTWNGKILVIGPFVKEITAFIYIRLFLTILNVVLRLEVPSLYKMQLFNLLSFYYQMDIVISKTKIIFWCNSLLVFRLFLLILKIWSILSCNHVWSNYMHLFCLCACVPLDVLLWWSDYWHGGQLACGKLAWRTIGIDFFISYLITLMF